MLCRCLIALAVSLVCIVAHVAPAAPFVNLDFEQATIPPGTPPGAVPADAGFPGWTPFVADVPTSFVSYNSTGIGLGEVVLYDQFLPTGIGVIQPRFSACLITDAGLRVPSSLSQVGEIPAEIQSIRFLADFFWPPALLNVNGIHLPLARMSNPANFEPIEWGADVSMFAGQTVELVFSSGPLLTARVVTVDAIRFSEQPIPEPGHVGLLSWLMMNLWQRRRADHLREEDDKWVREVEESSQSCVNTWRGGNSWP